MNAFGLAPGRPFHVCSRVLDLPDASNDLLAAGRQTKAILIRDEREARPCFEVARDFRALDLKTTQAITACNENREMSACHMMKSRRAAIVALCIISSARS
jgi:hypothetical protein